MGCKMGLLTGIKFDSISLYIKGSIYPDSALSDSALTVLYFQILYLDF